MTPETRKAPRQRNAQHKAILPLEYARPMERDSKSWGRRDILITLSAVAVGLSVFAAIFLPMTSTSRGPKTRQSDTNAKMVMLMVAISNFYQDYKRYPTNAEGLNILVTGVKLPDGSQTPSYVDLSSPINDEWGHRIIYRSSTSSNGPMFVIISKGFDGILGTEDDIIYPPRDLGTPTQNNPAPATQPAPDAITAAPRRAIP